MYETMTVAVTQDSNVCVYLGERPLHAAEAGGSGLLTVLTSNQGYGYLGNHGVFFFFFFLTKRNPPANKQHVDFLNKSKLSIKYLDIKFHTHPVKIA